jgi:GDP-D-mannose dehydratase
MQRFLVTVNSGQDGPYLAEPLSGKGYDVKAFVCRASLVNTGKLNSFHNDPYKAEPRRQLYRSLTSHAGINERSLRGSR